MLVLEYSLLSRRKPDELPYTRVCRRMKKSTKHEHEHEREREMGGIWL